MATNIIPEEKKEKTKNSLLTTQKTNPLLTTQKTLPKTKTLTMDEAKAIKREKIKQQKLKVTNMFLSNKKPIV